MTSMVALVLVSVAMLIVFGCIAYAIRNDLHRQRLDLETARIASTPREPVDGIATSELLDAARNAREVAEYHQRWLARELDRLTGGK